MLLLIKPFSTFVLFFCILNFISCEEEIGKLEIEENGLHFEEKIGRDRHGNVVFHVPAHGNRSALKRVSNAKKGFVAYNVRDHEGRKLCILKRKEEALVHEPSLEEATVVYKNVHELPKTGMLKVEHRLLPGLDVNVPPEMEDFAAEACERGAFKLFNDYDQQLLSHEKAVRFAKEAQTDMRKRVLLRSFIACDASATAAIWQCDHDKIHARCHARSRFCTYLLKCPMNFQKGGFSCDYQHEFFKLDCCDYTC